MQSDASIGHLLADEKVAYTPFESLGLLLKCPAHLATFLHYLLSNGFAEDEMFLLLHIDW